MNTKLIFLMIAALLVPSMVLAAADFGDISDITLQGDRKDNLSTTFTVKNTGDVNLTNVVITDDINSKYNIAYDITDLGTLNTNEEQAIVLTATIPDDEDFGVHPIGTITITSSEHNESFKLNLNVGSRLVIEEVEIIIEDKSDTLSNNGDTSDDKAKPGDDIELHVTVKNTFSDNIDINDILITAVILEVEEDEEDLEEEADEFDLEEGKSKTAIMTFKLPLEIEERTFDVEIYADGQSKEGDHEDFWTIHFELDKRTHDIIITESVLDDDVVDCGDSTTLTVELMNIGSNYEDDVAIEAKNLDLALSFNQYNIDLENEPWEEDNKYTKEIDINVPSDTKTGTYPIVVKAFYDRDALDYFKTVNLEVNCEELVEEEPEEELEEEPEEEVITEVVETEPPAEVEETTELEEVEITTSTEASLIKNPGKFSLLLIGNLVVIGLIILFLIKVLPSKNK